jgi:hypothetical protein
VGHSKTTFTDRSVEKADVCNSLFAAVAYSTWQSYSWVTSSADNSFLPPSYFRKSHIHCHVHESRALVANFSQKNPVCAASCSFKIRYKNFLTFTSRTCRRFVSYRLEKRKIYWCLYEASLNISSSVCIIITGQLQDHRRSRLFYWYLMCVSWQ